MGKFDHLATSPARGPADILKWKVVDAIAGKNKRDSSSFVVPATTPNHELIASGAPQLTWLGHASYLVTVGGKRVLIDPVLCTRMGPIKRLSAPGIAVDALPPIDVVVVTHNHRDHLDEWTIARLGAAPTYVVPLGNGAVLKKLGAERVIELDWWESTTLDDLVATIVPARHWSMRFPWDRNDALWGGVVLRGPHGAAYHSGDTAFFDGFEQIGARLGPIDCAMLPIGA
jgi:L-ascorbate metabolism protein UlaG (beta-lactamase superfamily)